MPAIGVVVASVREGRRGLTVARWVLEHAADRDDQYKLIDLAQHPLPHFREPIPPKVGRYRDQTTLDWARLISRFDAFVFVTAEYNHGVPSALKNALDHLHAEWSGKAAGLVGYGVAGGARAIDQLRVLAGTLNMADVGPQVELPLADINDDRVSADPQAARDLAAMLDAVESWAAALAPLRRQLTPTPHPRTEAP